MRVLIACEFSGRVRDAFRAHGHDAWSCDILPDETDPSQAHHFYTRVENPMVWSQIWDLVIAFPPCTHLASSGARWFKGKEWEQAESLDFVRWLMRFPFATRVPRIAIENPIGVISTRIRKPDQIVQPWMFGHGETKATCLWLENLPKLTPTNIVEGRQPRVHHESPGPERWKRRSRTLQGIADAMAEQWGSLPILRSA